MLHKYNQIVQHIDQDWKLTIKFYRFFLFYFFVILRKIKFILKNLKVNGYDFTYVTHKKAIEYLKKGKTLFMLVQRDNDDDNQ